MSIGQLTKRGAGGPQSPETPRTPIRSHLRGGFFVALAAVATAAFYVGLYVDHRYRFPIGYDTARYLFHTNFIAERGLGTSIPHLLPIAGNVTANRPGFPVLALTLASLFRASTVRVAASIPIVGAIATALAAGAFASRALRLKRWQVLLVSLLVATSAQVIRLFAPETYTDNLLAGAVLVAAFIPLMAAVQNGTSFLPAIVLLGVAGVIHPASFVIVLGALGLVGLAFVPASWREWREGRSSFFSTQTVRLAVVLGAATAITVIGLFGLIGNGPQVRGVYRGELAKKFDQDLPLYRFPLTLPLAAVGAVTLARASWRRRRERSVGSSREDDGDDTGSTPSPFAFAEGSEDFRHRFAVLLFAAWIAVAVLGVLAYLVGFDAPAHRFLAFLLPIPILIALGTLALAKVITSTVAIAAGFAVVIAAIAVFGFVGYRDLYVNIPKERGVQWMDRHKVYDTLTAETYLDTAGVPGRSPIVFVINDSGPHPVVSVSQLTYVIASQLRPVRTAHAHFYLGDPERFLQHQPTFRQGQAEFNKMSALLWQGVRRLLPARPVAILLATFNRGYTQMLARHPELPTINNVMVLSGPRPRASRVHEAIPASGSPRVFGLTLAALFVLSAVGLGWAAALLPRSVRSFEVLALSPAFGLAFVILAGVLFDRVGVRLTGVAGWGTPLLVGAIGWALAVGRLRRNPQLFDAD